MEHALAEITGETCSWDESIIGNPWKCHCKLVNQSCNFYADTLGCTEMSVDLAELESKGKTAMSIPIL